MAEAALMACRVTHRDNVVVLDTVNPRYRAVLDTYLLPQGIGITTVSRDQVKIGGSTACILAQYPNFYGGIEAMGVLSDTAHRDGALLVVSANPVALGMFKAPGDYGADIVTGETQPIGVPMSFGGPFVGYFTCKSDYIRQMPGRIVGRTVDHNDRVGYVLTLQTREQHIRRERATSNICTSEALIATGTAVCMAALGPIGLRQMAHLCYQKSHYAAEAINALDGYQVINNGPWFHEFVVTCPQSSKETTRKLLGRGIIGGLDISDVEPNGMLFCVTEMNTKLEIDFLVENLKQISTGL